MGNSEAKVRLEVMVNGNEMSMSMRSQSSKNAIIEVTRKWKADNFADTNDYIMRFEGIHYRPGWKLNEYASTFDCLLLISS